MLMLSVKMAFTPCADRLLHTIFQCRIDMLFNPFQHVYRMAFHGQQRFNGLGGADFHVSGDRFTLPVLFTGISISIRFQGFPAADISSESHHAQVTN